MNTVISLDELKKYLEGHKKHKAYQETLDLYTALRTHADGLCPEKLIHERRPSESLDVLEYRKKIYVPKTKNPIGKVITSLSKIRRSADWNIKYDPKTFPASILEEENPEKYNEVNYPGHQSVTNWVFSHLLKNYCIDANAVVMVIPNNFDAARRNEYFKPVATIFNSDQVLYFEDGASFAILKSTDRSDLVKDDGTTVYQQGSVYYFVTTKDVSRIEQTKEGSFTVTQTLIHNKGRLPVFKIKGAFLKQKDNSTIQESRIAAMLPSLDEAAREYSDLQASKVQHMFPLFWYYQNKSCNHCNGSGMVIDASKADGGAVKCSHCQGSGKIKFSPYAHLEMDPPKLGESAVPTPPGGYISRDVEIIKHQDSSVDKHLFTALASINMQFLDQTPLNISGEAKSVDREELNNFVYSIAEDLVWIMDRVYWWNNEWRYSVVVSDLKKREAMLPKIAVPENFDLLPADYLIDEISKAKTAKVNPILLGGIEQDYAAKKFYTNPELATQINCYYELDPLPGYTVDEKMSLLMNKGCTQEDFVISAYIGSFVKRAIKEDPLFVSKDYEQKMAIIQKYAQQKIKVTDAAEQVKQDLLMEQQNAFNESSNSGNPQDSSGGNAVDHTVTGKLPLALQQLSLAATRIKEIGNTALANKINIKIAELLKEIDVNGSTSTGNTQ